jgi:hypothetical protein
MLRSLIAILVGPNIPTRPERKPNDADGSLLR